VTLTFKPLKARRALQANVPFRGLALVQPRKPEPREGRSSEPAFSAAEMRHSFAIWVLRADSVSERQMHLYYCLRCKWSFTVDDRRRLVTPLDPNGNPIEGAAASARIATFSLGPCPAFSRLVALSRPTQAVTPVDTVRRCIAALISAGRRACTVSGWQSRPPRPTCTENAQLAERK